MMRSGLRNDIALSIAAGFACCFFSYALALNPFTSYSGYDPAIFQQVGLGMLQGRIPYVDLFDHKGFLLYAVNAIGLWLSPGHTGLYCLLSLCLSATFLCWLRISAFLMGNHALRYLPALLAMSFACLREGGNMTETWSLLPLSIPIYYLVRQEFKGQEISFRDCFCIGVCIGIVAHFRLNNIMPALAVCLYMFLDLLHRKEFTKLAKGTWLVFLGGCLVVLSVGGLYAGLYGLQHMEDYWFGNIGFNLLYVDRFAHEPLWRASGFYFPALSLTMMLCCGWNRGKKLVWFTLSAFLLTLLTTGRAYYAHYFTLFSPLIVVSLSLALGNSVFSIKKPDWRLTGLVLLVLTAGLAGIFRKAVMQKADNLVRREKAIAECSEVLNALDEKQKASIWNYNTMTAGANVLQRSGLVQCNRIFLPFQSMGDYGVEETKGLTETCPEVILADGETLREERIPANAPESKGKAAELAFIRQNYHLIYHSHSMIQMMKICIYARNKRPALQ